MVRLITAFFAVALLSSCAPAKGSGMARAERVPSDQSDYVCFIVRDEDGKAVGGNCVPN